jgi:GT2 family glycosyltransferase
MSDRPLVSVITGTWNRHELLMECIENVRQQTYRPLEHVIVSDGPDPELYNLLASHREDRESCPHEVYPYDGSGVPIRFVELGRNWSTYLTNSHACVPFMVANYVAAGEYQMWWSDDERALVPDHIEALVDFLEAGGYDFVSPMVQVYRADRPEERWLVGQDPPENGTVTHVLHKTSLLDIGGFRPHVGSGSDWDQVERWLDAGAKFGLLQRVTFSHRSDYMHRDTLRVRGGARA